VLVHVDIDQAHEQLINSRLAYVFVSRGRCDSQIYTNDARKLGEGLSRAVSKLSAMENEYEIGGQNHGHATENADHQPVSDSQEHGTRLQRGTLIEHMMHVGSRRLSPVPTPRLRFRPPSFTL
jgi:hypothetical protein